MEFALSTDSTEESGLNLLRRLWVVRFDVEEEGRALAERCEFLFDFLSCGSFFVLAEKVVVVVVFRIAIIVLLLLNR